MVSDWGLEKACSVPPDCGSGDGAHLGMKFGAWYLQMLSLMATPQCVTPLQGQEKPRLEGQSPATVLGAWGHFFPSEGFSRSHQRGPLLRQRVCEGKNLFRFEA